jgi:hypothetical protein
MRKVGSDEINLSVRDAAMGGGVTFKTAANSLGRLVGDGWLKRMRAQVGGNADSYKSLVAERLKRDTGDMPEDANPVDASHEIWVRLGKACMDVYSVLTSDPVSGRQIARRARVGHSTANDNLPRLEFYGLAARAGNGWVIGPVTPGEVVIDHEWTGVNSKTFQRQEQYAMDRVAYHAYVNGEVAPAPGGAAPF